MEHKRVIYCSHRDLDHPYLLTLMTIAMAGSPRMGEIEGFAPWKASIDIHFGGFLKWMKYGVALNHPFSWHFHRIFYYKPSGSWGTSVYGTPKTAPVTGGRQTSIGGVPCDLCWGAEL